MTGQAATGDAIKNLSRYPNKSSLSSYGLEAEIKKFIFPFYF